MIEKKLKGKVTRPDLPFWKKAFFAFAAAVLFVLVLELSARAAVRIFLGAEKAEHFNIIQSMLNGPLYKDETQRHISNKTGFRGPDFKLKKPKETFRVLTLGGSAMAGDLSHELRKLFTANCPAKTCEVIDGGVPGAVSIQELYNLNRWINYKPDLIIVYDGWNDVYYSHYTPERYRQQYQMTSKVLRKWYRPGHRIIRASHFVKTAIAARSKFKNFFDKPLYALETADDELEVSWMGGITRAKIGGGMPQDHFSEIYQRNLRAMADIAAKNHVPVLFILQPSLSALALKQGTDEAGEKILDKLKPKVREDWLKSSALLFPLAKKAHLEAAGYHQKPFYDFSEEPGMRQGFFSDLVHLNEEGNRWAAARIFEIYKKEQSPAVKN